MTRDSRTANLASAQVILRSASGARVRGDTAITAENVRDYMPSQEDANAAHAAFAQAGFDVGPLVGISFSITAPASTFVRFFGTHLTMNQKGIIVPAEGGGRDRLELPLDRLPPALASRLIAVTFTPPADLHGGGSSLMK